jgi:hypothetical protein
MPASRSEVMVGRRYLERGFLDAAMKLFVRNAAEVPATDWSALVDRLMERNRVADVVTVCGLASIPLPRERMLELGDRALRRRDLDAALRFFELGKADRERWAMMLDVLTTYPDRERQAVEVVARHLDHDHEEHEPEAHEEVRSHIRVVK